MSRRHYVNQAPQLALAANINSSVTSLTVTGTFSGWPVSYPYFAALELGGASLEIVSVTGVVGSVATIVRGQDGTSGLSHSAGATLDFVAVAADLDEANAHVNTTGGVHGITGNVVGDTDAQTLANKTLTNPKVGAIDATTAGLTINAAGQFVAVTGAALTANEGVQSSKHISGKIAVNVYATAAAADTAYAAAGITPGQGDVCYITAAPQGLYANDGVGHWLPTAHSAGLVKIASGTVSITPVANTPTSGPITFPFTFDSPPIVLVTFNGTVPGTVVTGVSVGAVSTTGATAWVTRTNNTATTLNWVAVQTDAS